MLLEAFGAPYVEVIDLFEDWMQLGITGPSLFSDETGRVSSRPSKFEITLRCLSIDREGQLSELERSVFVPYEDRCEVTLDQLVRHGCYDVFVRCVTTAVDTLKRGATGNHEPTTRRGPQVGQWCRLHVPLLPKLSVGQGEVFEDTVEVVWDFGGWVAPALTRQTRQVTKGIAASHSAFQITNTAHMTRSNADSDPVGFKDATAVADGDSTQLTVTGGSPATLFEIELRRTPNDTIHQLERLSVRYISAVSSLGGTHQILLEGALKTAVGVDMVLHARVRAFRPGGALMDPVTGGEYGSWSPFQRFLCIRRQSVRLCDIGSNTCRVVWHRRELPLLAEATAVVTVPKDIIDAAVVDATLECWAAGVSPSSQECVVHRATVTVVERERMKGLLPETKHDDDLLLSGTYGALDITSLDADTVYEARFSFRHQGGGTKSTRRFRFATLPPPTLDCTASAGGMIGSRFVLSSFSSARRNERNVTDLLQVKAGLLTSSSSESRNSGLTDDHDGANVEVVLEESALRSRVVTDGVLPKEPSHMLRCVVEVQVHHRGELLLQQLQPLGGVADRITWPSQVSDLETQQNAVTDWWSSLTSSKAGTTTTPEMMRDTLIKHLSGDTHDKPILLRPLPAATQVTLRVRCGHLPLRALLDFMSSRQQERVSQPSSKKTTEAELSAELATRCVFSSWYDFASEPITTLSLVDLAVEHRTPTRLVVTIASESLLQLVNNTEAASSSKIRPSLATLKSILVDVSEGDGRRIQEDEWLSVSRVQQLNGGADQNVEVRFDQRSNLHAPEYVSKIDATNQAVFTVSLDVLMPGTPYTISWNVVDTFGCWYGGCCSTVRTMEIWHDPKRIAKEAARLADADSRLQAADEDAYEPFIDVVSQRLHSEDAVVAASRGGAPLSNDVSVFPPAREAFLLSKVGGMASEAAREASRMALLESTWSTYGNDCKRRDPSNGTRGGSISRTKDNTSAKSGLQHLIASRSKPLDAPSLEVVMVGATDVVMEWSKIIWSSAYREVMVESKPLDTSDALTDYPLASNLFEYRLRLTWEPLPHVAVASRRPVTNANATSSQDGSHFRDFLFRSPTTQVRISGLSDDYMHTAALSVYDKLHGRWTTWSNVVSFAVTAPLHIAIDTIQPTGFGISWKKAPITTDPRTLQNPVIAESYSVVVRRVSWEYVLRHVSASQPKGGGAQARRNREVIATSFAEVMESHTSVAHESHDAPSSTQQERFEQMLEDLSFWQAASLEAGMGMEVDSSSREEDLMQEGEGIRRTKASRSADVTEWSYDVPAPQHECFVRDTSYGCYACQVRPRYKFDCWGPWSQPKVFFVYPLIFELERLTQQNCEISWSLLPCADTATDTQLFYETHFKVLSTLTNVDSGDVEYTELDVKAAQGRHRYSRLGVGTSFRLQGMVATTKPIRLPLRSIETLTRYRNSNGSPPTASTGGNNTSHEFSPHSMQGSSVFRRRVEEAVKRFPLSMSKVKSDASFSSRVDSIAAVSERRIILNHGHFLDLPLAVSFRTLGHVVPSVEFVGPDTVLMSWARIPRGSLRLGEAFRGPSVSTTSVNSSMEATLSTTQNRGCSDDADYEDAASGAFSSMSNFAHQSETYTVVIVDKTFGDVVWDTVTPTKALVPIRLSRRVAGLRPGSDFYAAVIPHDIKMCHDDDGGDAHEPRVVGQWIKDHLPVVAFTTVSRLVLFWRVVPTKIGAVKGPVDLEMFTSHVLGSSPQENFDLAVASEDSRALRSASGGVMFTRTAPMPFPLQQLPKDNRTSQWSVFLENGDVCTALEHPGAAEISVDVSHSLLPSSAVASTPSGESGITSDDGVDALPAEDETAELADRSRHYRFQSTGVSSSSIVLRRVIPGTRYTVRVREKDAQGRWNATNIIRATFVF